jgi:hypothetical protein
MRSGPPAEAESPPIERTVSCDFCRRGSRFRRADAGDGRSGDEEMPTKPPTFFGPVGFLLVGS